MKKIIQTTLMTIALATTSLFASGGHTHDANGGHSYQAPVNQEVAQEKALNVVNSFIKNNVVDTSWSSASINSIEKKAIKGNNEWVVIFINNKIGDEKKQKLYIFLTPSGQYIAANYTGN
jgi:hypothetical protein